MGPARSVAWEIYSELSLDFRAKAAAKI